jgi:KDO2-lipid IV(A) lauroyltransferase
VKRASDLPVYLVLRAALAVGRRLPRSVALASGAALGRLARVAGLRRAVTDANLAVAFPELSAASRARIARGMYAHLGRMAVDSLRLSASGPQAIVPCVDGRDALELVRSCLARGRGCLILTGHIGNWELAGAYLASQGVRLAAVVKPPSNPYLARQAEAVRSRLGIESVPMPEARVQVPRLLREGRAVALVADQGALRSNIWSPFFGQPTQTPVGPGLFASGTGASIVFGGLVAVGAGARSYRLIGEELEIDRSGELVDVIQRVADAYRQKLEALVRRLPEQYLWSHRLWKRRPAAAEAARP